MKVFISWSGIRSHEMAKVLNKWLGKVIQMINPWISSDSIEKGMNWNMQIGQHLEEINFGIICITPENMNAPWIAFEAGALSKSLEKARVCPLLLGLSPNELQGPLKQFQATTVEKEDLYKLISTINNYLERKLEKDILVDAYEKNWPEFEKEIERISKIEIDDSNNQIASVIRAFSEHGLINTSLGRQVIFSNGFESHNLYSIITENAKKRLYILGRKNRKLFDKEHHDFFKGLSARLSEGFDFKVLCLNPDSPDYIIKTAHCDDDFVEQLCRCKCNAVNTLKKYGVPINEVIREYSINRTISCIIIDDVVIFTPVVLGDNGRAKPLTKAPFSVISINSELGKEIYECFVSIWNNSKKISNNE